MRAVVQRVSSASVLVDKKEISSIGQGLLVLIGISREDSEKQALAMAKKICHLRIFTNEEGKMAHSIIDLGYELLLVSQFTLYGDVHSGRRPDFLQAAAPEKAESLFDRVVTECRVLCTKEPKTGSFGAKMEVQLVNDGPVTLWVDV